MTLALFRFALLSGSFTPVLIVWYARGLPSVPDLVIRSATIPGWGITLAGVALAVGIPNLIVWLRWRWAHDKDQSFDQHIVSVKSAESSLVEFVLTVLLAMMFVDLDDARSIAVASGVLLFIILLFSALRRDFVNPWFLAFGYHCYHAEIRVTVSSSKSVVRKVFVLSKDGTPPTGDVPKLLRLDNRLFVYRL